jgi:hypothetical protein
MSHDFTLWDAADPNATVQRDLAGRPVLGLDYFKALAERLSADHANVLSIELFTQRDQTVLALTRHVSLAPTITAWERYGDTWKAVRLTINVSEETVANLRNTRASA